MIKLMEMQLAAQTADIEVEKMSMAEIGEMLWKAAKAASNEGFTLDECFEEWGERNYGVDQPELESDVNAVDLEEALEWSRRQQV